MLYVIDIIIFVYILYTVRKEKIKLIDLILVALVCLIQFILPASPLITISLLLIVFFYFTISLIIIKDIFISVLIAIYHLIGLMTAIIIIPRSDIWLFHNCTSFFSFENFFILGLSNFIIYVLITFSKTMFEDENRFHRSIIIIVNLSSFGLILYYHLFYDIKFLDQYAITTNNLYKAVFLILILFYYQLFIAIKYYYEIAIKNQKLNDEMIRNSIEFEELSKQQSYAMLDRLRNYLNKNDFENIFNMTQEYLLQNDNNLKSNSFRNLENLYLSNYLQKLLHANPDVNFNLEISHKDTLKKFNQEKYYLEMIGIIIDNAVHASSKSTDKIVRFVVTNNSIKVINSFHQNDVVDLLSSSSKKGSRDRINGLKLLKHISKKSDISIIKTVEDYVCFEMVVE